MIQNLAAGDSFLLVSKEDLHVFQLTRSLCHHILWPGLLDILNACGDMRRVKFIFVVPAPIFQEYNVQKFVSSSKTGKVLKRLTGGRSCEIVQYALCIDVGL